MGILETILRISDIQMSSLDIEQYAPVVLDGPPSPLGRFQRLA
jgi:hypothetical protein